MQGPFQLTKIKGRSSFTHDTWWNTLSKGILNHSSLECDWWWSTKNSNGGTWKNVETTLGQTLAKKVLRYGYFWPTINHDAADHARRCDRCQRFGKIKWTPSTELTQIVNPWLFAIWGIDLIGVLPIAKGEAKYAIVAINYFIKWAKAEPLATITIKKDINFVIKNIICRFSVLQKIITDNRM